jgi:putative lipoic acid-binding regulatory protein
MSTPSNPEEFYKKLKLQLLDTTLWPSEYLYKFIVISDKEKLNKIASIFNHLGAVIENRPSKNGKYTSVSINVRMKNPDAVIEKYKEVAEKVEGVISL